MTSKELTTIIDAFNASRPNHGLGDSFQWGLCVNTFITHCVTRNILTEDEIDTFYLQLETRRIK